MNGVEFGKSIADETPRLTHGGDLSELLRLAPAARLPLIDLSTGINPHAYPLPEIPLAAHARLPRPDEIAQLEAAAAKAYGVDDANMVTAAPGTQALIQLIPRLVDPSDVAVLAPTYEEHARSWRAAGHAVSQALVPEELRGAQCAVIVNPNNPTGALYAPDDVLALLNGTDAPRLMIVDEAFMDLMPGPHGLAPHLTGQPIIILRSFGKTYGLAGIRLGFAIAGGAIGERLRRAVGPWAVSSTAIAVGRQALGDSAWLERMRTRLAEDVRWLDARLEKAGMQIVGGTPLFRLAAAPHAPQLFYELAEAGIWVRRFPANPEWLRFGIPGTDEARSRLETVLRRAAS